MKNIILQNRIRWTLLCLFAVFFANAQEIKIDKGWQFRQANQNKWLAAKVPGEIHTDLLRHNLIPDPFFGTNESKVQWVEEKDWEYQTTFDVLPSQWNQKNIELRFDGLDTYAKVYLNNNLILEADNMFRSWDVSVKNLLKQKNNVLKVIFESAQNKVNAMAKAQLPYIIPDNPRVYARKAQYHFGWDWGPKLTTCGIWKPIKLVAYNQKEIEKPYQAPVKAELIRENDDVGQSFYFKIDGKTVYMKGANYIPSDAFLSRVSKFEYQKIIKRAKDANMNMLRVWGGGIYEDDYFYELCDKNGIYVWQDFMFAGTMVPGDNKFFENVKQEVLQQVKRLRKHKSIVLWCGNNEIDEAFKNWGWQKQYKMSAQDSTKLWNDYKRLFHDSIPKWVNQADGARPYVTTSPLFGWGRKQSFTHADSHYWGTWWGLEDIEKTFEKTGRFVSEYGMQAMPNYNSLQKIASKEDLTLFSDVLKAHQKAGKGFDKLNSYLHRYFVDTTNITKRSVKEYTYLTQCLQYYSLKNIIAIHRSKMPYNMGTLLWQLNDCWPVASWSITDYYHRQPKAAWYAVKEAYRDDVKPQINLERPINFQLKNPEISWKQQGNKLIISAKNDAKFVYLSADGYTEPLSDNYFDLKANETKIILLEGKPKKWNWQVFSFYDIKK